MTRPLLVIVLALIIGPPRAASETSYRVQTRFHCASPPRQLVAAPAPGPGKDAGLFVLEASGAIHRVSIDMPVEPVVRLDDGRPAQWIASDGADLFRIRSMRLERMADVGRWVPEPLGTGTRSVRVRAAWGGRILIEGTSEEVPTLVLATDPWDGMERVLLRSPEGVRRLGRIATVLDASVGTSGAVLSMDDATLLTIRRPTREGIRCRHGRVDQPLTQVLGGARAFGGIDRNGSVRRGPVPGSRPLETKWLDSSFKARSLLDVGPDDSAFPVYFLDREGYLVCNEGPWVPGDYDEEWGDEELDDPLYPIESRECRLGSTSLVLGMRIEHAVEDGGFVSIERTLVLAFAGTDGRVRILTKPATRARPGRSPPLGA